MDEMTAVEQRGAVAAWRAEELCRRRRLLEGGVAPTPADVATAREGVRLAIARSRAALSRTLATYERAKAVHLNTAAMFERSGDVESAGRRRAAAATCAVARDHLARRLEAVVRADDAARWDRVAAIPLPVDTLETLVGRGAIEDHPCPICGAEAAVVLTETTVLCPECGQLAQILGASVSRCAQHEWTMVRDEDRSVVEEHCVVCGDARLVDRG